MIWNEQDYNHVNFGGEGNAAGHYGPPEAPGSNHNTKSPHHMSEAAAIAENVGISIGTMIAGTLVIKLLKAGWNKMVGSTAEKVVEKAVTKTIETQTENVVENTVEKAAIQTTEDVTENLSETLAEETASVVAETTTEVAASTAASAAEAAAAGAAGAGEATDILLEILLGGLAFF